MTNIVKLMARLENGDSILVSVKANDKPLSSKDKQTLLSKYNKSIKPVLEDVLYFTIRTTINDNKDNWKCSSPDEVFSVLDCIFK